MSKGVDIRQLEPLTTMILETESSIYHIELFDPATGEVTIVGGAIFPEPTVAYIEGSCEIREAMDEKWLSKGLSMVIKFKTGKQRKYRIIKTEPMIALRLTAPDDTWSFNMWEK